MCIVKKSYIKIITFIMPLMLVLAACSSGQAYEISTAAKAAYMETLIIDQAILDSKAPENMELVTTKGYLSMYADLTSGHFSVEDLRSGKQWKTLPDNNDDDPFAQGIMNTIIKSQIVITAFDPKIKNLATITSYASCEMTGGITVNKVDGGINVLYDFKAEGIKIPVAYRLTEDGLRLQIDTEKIEENEILLQSISVLPVFGAAGMDSDGFILLANGSGSIMNFNNKKSKSTPFIMKVYGDDKAYQPDKDVYFGENYSLPVFGIQSEKKGLLAIADIGAAEASVNAASAGQVSGLNNAYFSFDIRGYQTVSIGDKSTWNYQDILTFEEDKIQTGKIGIRYLMLGEDEQGTAGMANVFRSYLLKSSDFEPAAMPELPPVYLSMLGALERNATMLGIEYKKTEKITTFANAAEMTEELQNNGVAGIHLLYDNWSEALLKNRITASANTLGILGGKNDLTKLIDKLKSGGGNLSLNTEFIYYSESGGGVRKNTDSIKDINNSPVIVNTYKRNTLFPDEKIPKRQISKLTPSGNAFLNMSDNVLALNPNISMTLGTLGNTLFTDFGNEGFRRHMAEAAVRNIFEASKSKTNIIGDNPNFYTLPYLNSIVNMPLYHTAYDGLDESIPFLQMVLHGIMPYGSRALNTYGNPENEFLKCIETGAILHYEMIYENNKYLSFLTDKNYFGAEYKNIKDTVIEKYKSYSKLYNLTAAETITGYEKTATGLIKTTYSNGVYTLVNYSENDVIADGVTVPSMDFAIIEG